MPITVWHNIPKLLYKEHKEKHDKHPQEDCGLEPKLYTHIPRLK